MPADPDQAGRPAGDPGIQLPADRKAGIVPETLIPIHGDHGAFCGCGAQAFGQLAPAPHAPEEHAQGPARLVPEVQMGIAEAGQESPAGQVQGRRFLAPAKREAPLDHPQRIAAARQAAAVVPGQAGQTQAGRRRLAESLEKGSQGLPQRSSP